jgi:hypothetical protein
VLFSDRSEPKESDNRGFFINLKGDIGPELLFAAKDISAISVLAITKLLLEKFVFCKKKKKLEKF